MAHASSPAAPSAADSRLLIVVVDDPYQIDEVITGFLEFGIRGATVIESRGM